MNNKELTLEIVKKSLMDIEWLEESDAKDIYEALEKNILSNVDIKPLEIKEEPKEDLPTHFILKVDKSNKNEIDAVLFVYNKYISEESIKYKGIISGMIYSHNEYGVYIKNFNSNVMYPNRTFLATLDNIKARNRKNWPIIDFETFSKIFKNELKEYYEKSTTTELPF